MRKAAFPEVVLSVQVSLQWKNHDFLSKNPDFRLKNGWLKKGWLKKGWFHDETGGAGLRQPERYDTGRSTEKELRKYSPSLLCRLCIFNQAPVCIDTADQTRAQTEDNCVGGHPDHVMKLLMDEGLPDDT